MKHPAKNIVNELKLHVLAAFFIAAIFAGCQAAEKKQSAGPVQFTTLRDVPGITNDEITAIEVLRQQKGSFVYGMPLSTEAFINEKGEMGGFAAEICGWLSGIFGIPFVPVQCELSDLFAGLENGSIDFTGELRETDERRSIYSMTGPIAERILKYFYLESNPTPDQIMETRILRCGFIEGTSTIAMVSSRLEPGTYETVFMESIDQVYDMLVSGQIDAFYYSDPAEARFDEYDDVTARNFYPLVFNPVSLSTQNDELRPVISIVQKILDNNGFSYLNELYNKGYNDYLRNKFNGQLNDEERAYIRSRRAVPYAAEYFNYPVSFYNVYEKQWQGIFFDILEQVRDLSGLSFTRINDQNTEWPDLIEMVENGEAAMISELIPSRGRAGNFLWPQTPTLTDHYVLLSKTKTRDIGIHEVWNVKIGIPRNTAYSEVFNSWFVDHEHVIEYETSDRAFTALENEEVEMVMSSQRRLLGLTNYNEFSGYKANLVFDPPSDSFIGFNIDEAILCSIMDKALGLIDVEGLAGRWMHQTYDYKVKIAQAQRPWLYGAVIMFLCIVVLLLILFQKKIQESRKLENLVQIRTDALGRQLSLTNVVNNTAVLLLESGAENYLDSLSRSMEIICQSLDVDRAYLWQCFRRSSGKLYYKQISKWTAREYGTDKIPAQITYHNSLPGWEEQLSQGVNINGPLDSFPEEERHYLETSGIYSLLAVPLFLQGHFWGFAIFHDCHRQRFFSKAEEHALFSWGLLAVGVIQRGEISIGMQKTLKKSAVLQRDLKTAVENAKNASKSKSEFLANMSHEIRTPLNAIIGLSELELGADNLTGSTLDSMEKIYYSGMTLLGIINDILDISKIESGKLEIHPVEYDVPSLINDTVNLNIVRIGSKPIDFRLHPDENLPARLFGDELRVKQIFNNLLSNAFKYTRKGSVDWYISSVWEGDQIWIESRIEDTGIGIRNEDLPRLFGEYTRVDIKSTRTIEGTGLGLSISQKMAKLMDGEITVKSEYGKGSLFTVRICQKSMGPEKIGKELAGKLAAFRYTFHRRNKDRSLVRAWIPYASVLVVDDMPANHTVTKGILKPYGLTVDCVSSGLEAIDRIQDETKKYNAIFMDHMMPDMDGIETVNIIRKELGATSEYARNIPIIALTANAIIGTEEIFLQNGFQAFLTKPIDILQMDRAINRWVRDKKLERKLRSKTAGAKSAEAGDSNSPAAGGDRRVPAARGGNPFNRAAGEGSKHSSLTEDPVIEALLKAGENIKDLDIMSSLASMDWDKDTWIEVVRSFVETTPPLLEILKKPDSANLGKYSITVHGIKSVCFSFGARKAGEKAKELEERSVAGDLAFVEENNQNFTGMIKKLLEDLTVLLETVSQETRKPAKEKPDPEILEKILEAADSYNIRNLDEGIAILEKFSYTDDEELVQWLRKQCNSSDFAAIRERLVNYKEQNNGK